MVMMTMMYEKAIRRGATVDELSLSGGGRRERRQKKLESDKAEMEWTRWRLHKGWVVGCASKEGCSRVQYVMYQAAVHLRLLYSTPSTSTTTCDGDARLALPRGSSCLALRRRGILQSGGSTMHRGTGHHDRPPARTSSRPISPRFYSGTERTTDRRPPTVDRRSFFVN